MISLSIIIISFNTEEITKKCLLLLKKNFNRYPLNYEVIVIDNNSFDNSSMMLLDLKNEWSNLHIVLSKKNLGFSKANNLGLSKCRGKYILYLNSDTLVYNINFKDLINLLENHNDIGALTVKVILPNGQIDPASHRGFPTLWNSLTYFLGLEKFFKNIPILNRIFGGYHLINLNSREVHEVDVLTGAFFFTRKKIVDKIGGFDEVYFAYGEDIELAFQIKKLGYKIVYYPLWEALHIKSLSGLKKKDSKIRKKTGFFFYDSMKIFYKKHYAESHNWLINQLVYLVIEIKKILQNEKNRN